MAAKTAAQEEFDSIFDQQPRRSQHPEDDHGDSDHGSPDLDDLDEETVFHQQQINAAMRIPALDRDAALSLPHRSFDRGRATGVKGVIADARSYAEARKSSLLLSRIGERTSRLLSTAPRADDPRAADDKLSDVSDDDDDDDDDFLERWRETRRRELQQPQDIRTRRTSPSARRFGRLEDVDALGYLDAIEKVGREVVVVVLVYDSECEVSQTIEAALLPLVTAYPTVRFAKVHYEDIEFDNAGVPAILGYKNQGDLFANLTYIVDQISDDVPFDSQALEDIFKKHRIL